MVISVMAVLVLVINNDDGDNGDEDDEDSSDANKNQHGLLSVRFCTNPWPVPLDTVLFHLSNPSIMSIFQLPS